MRISGNKNGFLFRAKCISVFFFVSPDWVAGLLLPDFQAVSDGFDFLMNCFQCLM